jgi:hypothetical protein
MMTPTHEPTPGTREHFLQLTTLRRWEREGVKPAPADADTINEGVRILATPPSRHARLHS